MAESRDRTPAGSPLKLTALTIKDAAEILAGIRRIPDGCMSEATSA